MSKLFTGKKLPIGIFMYIPNHHYIDSNRKKFISPEYYSWRSMIHRCYYSNSKKFSNYGGRGIKVCTRWVKGDDTLSGFQCFLLDMGNRPPSKTLDRIDNNKGYTRENCRWAERGLQEQNKRINPKTSSKYKGVSYRNDTAKRTKPWRADISIDNTNKYLGSFTTEEEAALMYNEWAVKVHGSGAYINIIEDTK